MSLAHQASLSAVEIAEARDLFHRDKMNTADIANWLRDIRVAHGRDAFGLNEAAVYNALQQRLP